MYKWLKEYFTAFGKDFPFSEVADLNEYEIIRIIQYCVKTNTEYATQTENEKKAIVEELENPENWQRVYEPKQIRMVAFKHKVG